MKTLWLLTLVLLVGCLSQNSIHEDTLYVTRKYVGDLDTITVDKSTTNVFTTEALYCIWGKPRLNIPKGARCYVKYIPQRMPGTANIIWILYFTWDGTDDLIMLRQNYITGEVW